MNIKWKSNIKLAYEKYRDIEKALSNKEQLEEDIKEKILWDLWRAILRDLREQEREGE